MKLSVGQAGALVLFAAVFGGLMAILMPVDREPADWEPAVIIDERSKPAGGRYEFAGYRSEFFELRQMEVGHRGDSGHSVFVAPVDWIQGLTDRDNIWIGREDGSYRVQWSGGLSPARGDISNALKREVDLFTDWAKARGVIGRIKMGAERGATVMEFVTPGASAEENMLVQNIALIRPRSTVVMSLAFHVHVRRDLWDKPESKDLIRLFREQAFRGVATQEDSLEENLPPAGKDWRWDLRDVEAKYPYGFIRLRLPKAWREQADPEMVGYSEPRRRSGEVWIAYDVLGTAVPSTKASEGASRSVKTIDRWHEGNGRPRLHQIWMVTDRTDDQLILVTVTLILTEEQLKHPEFQDLTKIVDHEARRMRIGLAPNLSSNPSRAKDQADKAERK